MNPTKVFVPLLLILAACGAESAEPATSPTAGTSPSAVTELEDGPITPGRYRFTVRNTCEVGDPIGCPDPTVAPPPTDLEVTVTAGWQHWRDFGVITPEGVDPTEGPDGAALVMGWTTFNVGLNSDPCLSVGHEVPDIKVGPTVDDFVDAVQAHKTLDVSKPVKAAVGGYPAQFFSLEGPSDISGCDNWRPWDPGFFVQGPDNHWDVWAVDIGYRLLIVTQHFPGTPVQIVAELREMVESITFHP